MTTEQKLEKLIKLFDRVVVEYNKLEIRVDKLEKEIQHEKNQTPTNQA